MNRHILMSIFTCCTTWALNAGPGCPSCPGPKKPEPRTTQAPKSPAPAPLPTPAPAPLKKAPSIKTGQLHKFENLRTRRDDQDLLAKIKEHPKVILEFHREASCPPCRQLAPVLEQLARERDDVLIVKVNIQEDPVISRGVRSVPTMHFYKNGSQVHTEVGFKDKNAMHNIINSKLGSKGA